MILDSTLLIIICGTALLGCTAGLLGVFVLLRKQSLLGDTIAHAALPGIAITFLLTHSKNPALLLIGGSLASSVALWLMHIITNKTSIKKDTAMGIVLSVFFGAGLVLMTIIQKKPIPHQSILNKFLFGNASTLLPWDLLLIFCVSLLFIFMTYYLWHPFKLISFDYQFAHTIGYQPQLVQCILTTLVTITVVLGLQTVGIILMSTMLVAPAAAARQWTNRIEQMAPLAMILGTIAAVAGSIISSTIAQLPTGPVIVVLLTFFVFVSLLLTKQKPRLVLKTTINNKKENIS